MKTKAVNTKPDVKIAGNFTVANWKDRKIKLETVRGPDNWKQAYKDFFKGRLETRYLEPISAVIEHGDKAGEGFSIVALHCTLIEFLASTLEGKSYKHRPPDADADWKCGEHEYSKPSKLFINFLRTEIPFKDHFTRNGAEDFYDNVRCALIHEARTKGEWRILAGSSADPPIDVKEKIVYRDNFQSAVEEFVCWYGENLPKCEKLQEAFIRKFDSLCKE